MQAVLHRDHTYIPEGNAALRLYLQSGMQCCIAALTGLRQQVPYPVPFCSPTGSAAAPAKMQSGWPCCIASLP